MSGIDDLTAFLTSSDTISSLSSAVGASEEDTRKAIGTAVPALLGGLAVETENPESAAALTEAVERDHSGDIFDQLASLLDGSGSGKQFDGAGIVGHVFGNDETEVVNSLSAKSGANAGLVTKLLPILAPIVMGWLAKKLGGSGSGSGSAAASGSGGGGLTDILGSVLGQASGSSGGGLVDIIGGMLGGASGGTAPGAGSGGLGDLIGSIFGDRS
jgi:hypothetical protein